MLCSITAEELTSSLPSHRRNYTKFHHFLVGTSPRLLRRCKLNPLIRLSNLPDIVTIVLCSIVMDNTVKIIITHHTLLLACKLNSLLDVYSIVAFLKVHDFLVEYESFEVYNQNFWQ